MSTDQYQSIIQKLEHIEDRIGAIEVEGAPKKFGRSMTSRMMLVATIVMLLMTGVIYFGFQYIFSNLLGALPV